MRRLQALAHARHHVDPTPTPSPMIAEIAPRHVASAFASVDPADLAPDSIAATATPVGPGRAPGRTSFGRVAIYLVSLVSILVAWRGREPVALSARSYVAVATGLARLASLPIVPKGMGASLVPPVPAEVLDRQGHVSIPGGVMFLPSTLATDDGAYDLIIHFHGNTAVVRESVEAAGLNAAVAIVNLGVGSAPYEEIYGVPGTYEDLLKTIDRGLAARGVDHPRLRRVALSAWSAGYGSISTILQVRKGKEDLDAILVFDGIHCGWEAGELNHRQMKPFLDAAQRARRGEIFFGITHSEIDPRTYASTTATSSYLLERIGVARHPLDPVADAPTYIRLPSMKGAVSSSLEKTMEPTSEARVGSMHVIGYRGESKEHHMAHLFEMGATLYPELKARWEGR